MLINAVLTAYLRLSKNLPFLFVVLYFFDKLVVKDIIIEYFDTEIWGFFGHAKGKVINSR